MTAHRGQQRTVLALLEHAASAAERVGVADERLALTFGQLLRRVAGGAAVLAEAGIGRGDIVAIALPNSVGFVETLLGVLASGAAALPISAAARPAEARRLLDASRVAALVAHEGLAEVLPAATLGLAWTPRRGLGIDRRAARPRPARVDGGAGLGTGPPQAGDPALVAYSSGSTAQPHAAVRTHANLWWEAENFWSATHLGPDDVILGVVPLSHAHGFGNALLAWLRAGARLVVRPRFLRLPVLDVLARERVTAFPTVPFMVRMLALADRRRSWDLGALRWCLSAGAPLTPEVFAAFRRRFGVAVRQLYGTTETGSVTLNTAPPERLDPTSVGRPLGTVEVTVESERGHPLPPGETGEIVVRSPAAAGGAAHTFHTRDQGHWSARGELVLTGRTSLFINTAGNKVDPAEVEAALRLHPGVRDVAVFGQPAPHGEQVVAAAVVLRAPCSPDALRLHCRGLLAAYKVPRVVTFRRALPRSPLGKVLIGQLLTEA